MFFGKTAIFAGADYDSNDENSRCSTVASKNIINKNKNLKPQYNLDQLNQMNSFFSKLEHINDEDLDDDVSSVDGNLSHFDNDMEQREQYEDSDEGLDSAKTYINVQI